MGSCCGKPKLSPFDLLLQSPLFVLSEVLLKKLSKQLRVEKLDKDHEIYSNSSEKLYFLQEGKVLYKALAKHEWIFTKGQCFGFEFFDDKSSLAVSATTKTKCKVFTITIEQLGKFLEKEAPDAACNMYHILQKIEMMSQDCLSTDELRVLSQVVMYKIVPEGDWLVEENQNDSAMYVVVKGHLREDATRTTLSPRKARPTLTPRDLRKSEFITSNPQMMTMSFFSFISLHFKFLMQHEFKCWTESSFRYCKW